MEPSLKQWTFAFEMAVLDILATRSEEVSPDAFRLFAEPCPRHDSKCARVTYGALIDHFPWQQTDPAALAATLLGTMLPRQV